MQKYVKQQIRTIYGISALEALHIAGASWVALLAARGFSVFEIGILESIFHVVSMCFEIPSGAVADAFGRKRTMAASEVLMILSILGMLCSGTFWTVAVAIGISALSYNMASGTREALAYDTLKENGQEQEYDRFASMEMVIYRLGSATAVFCAGLALILGYRRAYLLDLGMRSVCLLLTLGLREPKLKEKEERNGNAKQDAEREGEVSKSSESVSEKLKNCVVESLRFLRSHPETIGIIALNSLIGAVATLLLFFLQARLPVYGLKTGLLGPALFFMSVGAACGAKAITFFRKKGYKSIAVISICGVLAAFGILYTKQPYLICLGGFLAAFSDDFLEVRTDVLLNEKIPSAQRATLISVCSFAFSVVMIFLSPLISRVIP